MNAPAPVPGQCARCGDHGLTVTSSHIISEKFTEFDTWPFGMRRLCVPCAWAYSHKLTTQPAMLITATTLTEYALGSELTPMLTAGPLPATHSVLVPSPQRRRHILPHMQWGHLATDKVLLPWNEIAAQRLADLVWLRSTIGASWPQLNAPAPPARLVTSQPADVWPRVVAAWQSLQPWRAVPPLWATARILTN